MTITKEDLIELQNKMYEIWKIPKLYGNGTSWEGVEISVYNDELEISGKSYTRSNCGCCPGEDYSFQINLDEINNPIEYFEEKYKKELDDHNKKNEEEKKLREEKEKQDTERREKENYETLKKKYENQ